MHEICAALVAAMTGVLRFITLVVNHPFQWKLGIRPVRSSAARSCTTKLAQPSGPCIITTVGSVGRAPPPRQAALSADHNHKHDLARFADQGRT